MTKAEIETRELTYHVPPVCQGQIVEFSFALTEDGEYVVRRTLDRSDGSTTYEVAETGGLNEYDFQPWNSAPPIPEDAWAEVGS